MSSIPHPLLTQISVLLSHACPSLSLRLRLRLSWSLWAILLSRSCVLRQVACTVASCVPSLGHASSHERRLRRTIADPRVCWTTTYAPVLRYLLRNLSGSLTLIVDESGHTDVVRVLSAALWFRGRAIPLAWITWKAQTRQEHSYWQDCQRLLDRVATLLPSGVRVIVVADRAFGCPAFLDPLKTRGWEWVVRVQGQTKLQQVEGEQAGFKTKLSQQGQYWSERVQVFKKQGWRTMTAVGYWRKGCAEPLLLVSSLMLPMLSVRLYRFRAAIEALFREWKSYGWQWENSQVRELEHQERLLVLLGLASVLTLLLGVEVANELEASAKQQGKRRPWEARDSLFQLGRQRCLRRLWTNSQEPLLEAFPEIGTRSWQQICWANAAPDARRSEVKDGKVVHRK